MLRPWGGAPLGWEQLSLAACVGRNILGSIFDITGELVSHGADKGTTSSLKHISPIVALKYTSQRRRRAAQEAEKSNQARVLAGLCDQLTGLLTDL